MEKYFGQSLYGGSAYGKLYILEDDECPVRRYHIDNSNEEIERFETAKETAKNELEHLYQKASSDFDEYEARIFITQKEMLFDQFFTESVYNIISEQMVNAEIAVAQTCDILTQVVSDANDERISSRCLDIKDVSERVIRILLGIHKSELSINEPMIIAAHDLQPSDILRFKKDTVLGFVFENGKEDTHAALLAKSMNVPVIIKSGAFMHKLNSEQYCIIDGDMGILYVNPDSETLAGYKR